MNFLQPESVVDRKLVETIENKRIDSVIEARSKLTPTAALWVGETTDGYFKIFLVAGSIMVLWAEREYIIKYGLKEWVCVGITEQTMDLVKTGINEEFIKNVTDINTFNAMANDVDETKFSDIMSLLKWKYKNKKVKLEFDELNITI